MGEWQERGKARDYPQPQSVQCAACGRIIATRTWVVAERGRELLFCDPGCERIYREYWLPRYGPAK